jgi:hypothetical protein
VFYKPAQFGISLFRQRTNVLLHHSFESAPVCARSSIMTDYSKLKVAELKDLLSARSLPVSGKKEELIARLTESDASNHVADDLGDLAPPEEEYDWDTPATQRHIFLMNLY